MLFKDILFSSWEQNILKQYKGTANSRRNTEYTYPKPHTKIPERGFETEVAS